MSNKAAGDWSKRAGSGCGDGLELDIRLGGGKRSTTLIRSKCRRHVAILVFKDRDLRGYMAPRLERAV
jgi:hypothetical protein